MPSATSPRSATSPDDRALSSAKAGVRHLRNLLFTGQGDAARSFVRELAARYPDSEAVTEFARVLAPPVTRVVPRQGRRLDRDYAWLREHAQEYPGCWLAIHEDELLAA